MPTTEYIPLSHQGQFIRSLAPVSSRILSDPADRVLSRSVQIMRNPYAILLISFYSTPLDISVLKVVYDLAMRELGKTILSSEIH
jgi:hypothetical protein